MQLSPTHIPNPANLGIESKHRKALLCLLLSSAIFIAWGGFIAVHSPSGMGAFKAVFYTARCLIHHADPYEPATLQQLYTAEGGTFPSNPVDGFLFRRAMLVCVNLPTSLFLVAPLALLPWKVAALIWMALNAASLMLAAFAVWTIAKDQALRPATLLICLLLSNAELVFALGNLAGLVTSLCAIAVCCFLEDKHVGFGVFCLAVSLVLKPHDSAMVWFYFLLAGGAHRKRALLTLAVAALLTLPAALWVSHVAPQWLQELRANLYLLSAHGSVNDPGPDSLTFHSADTVISLQAFFSLIRDDPRFYNIASYLISGVLLCLGAVRVLKSRYSKANAWCAIAAITALSMLPVYHRAYDAKLLLLAVPACALLWREGGRLKWIAALVTTLALLCTADVPATILLNMMTSMRGGIASLGGRLLIAFVFHPAPLILLATGSFYLWIYFRRTANEKQRAGTVNDSLGAAVTAISGPGL
jgi:hypothetical protein